MGLIVPMEYSVPVLGFTYCVYQLVALSIFAKAKVDDSLLKYIHVNSLPPSALLDGMAG